jgi:hypothetical protein
MLALPLLIIAFPFLVAVPVIAALAVALAALLLLSPLAALLAGYVWVGTHILSFVQSLFG